jgi:GNAT superfamily N-acetyltransferase
MITISTNKSLLDPSVIHGFLTNSYWAKGISLENVEKRLKNALCFGVYDGDNQIGFARVISDYESFAYLADVFILETHRGQGLSKRLMQTVFAHPKLQNLRRFMLATADAHGLYSQYGFQELKNVERWMEKVDLTVYERIT